MLFPRLGFLGLLLWLTVLPSTAKPVQWHTAQQASVLVCGGSMMNGNHFADSTLAGMREHYPDIRWTDMVQIVEHLTPAETRRPGT